MKATGLIAPVVLVLALASCSDSEPAKKVQKKASPAQIAQADRANATEFGRRIGTELRDRGVSDMDLVAEAVSEACLAFADGFVSTASPRYDVLSETCADEAVTAYVG